GLGPFTHNWDNSSTLNNDTIINPFANPLSSTVYTATVTSADGCTKQVTSNINVSGVGPTLTVTPSDTNICAGESVPLTTTAFVYPLTCGISSGCSGTQSTPIIGTGTSTSSTYGPFYGSTSNTTNYTKKVQYIYTAAELNALGYFGGTIENFALFNTTINTYRYDKVKVWFGCTSQSEYTNTTFIPTGSLTQVFGSTNNINPADNAWHYFNVTDWDWDGSSNLVIQICAEEDGPGNVGSNSVRYHSTSPAYRCVYDYSSTVTSCNEATGSRSVSRPNIRFRICSETAPTPTYSWTTTVGLTNSAAANPTATPSTTTSYVLDVTSAGCTGSTIAQINVSPNYTLNPSASNTSICYGTSVSLLGNPSGAVTSTDWSPTGAFGAPTATNPTVTPTGPTTYYINTSNGFCNKLDSITINVAGTPVGARTSKDTVCAGETINLSTISASATCGINYSNCTGASTNGVSGAAITASTLPGPFYGSTATNTYTTKRQYLFTAAELTAMGFTAGMITKLELDVSTSLGYSYDNMEIWMGCTVQDNYPTTTFIPTTALLQVYSIPRYTTTTGWNAFNITGYDWDGISNIVVQICSSNPDRTGSEGVRYTTTIPIYKTLYFNTNIAGAQACTNATGIRYFNRPNMRFTFCSSSFGAGSTYSWSPATVSNPVSSTPTANIGSNQTYTVTVTDPANPGCPTTGTVDIYIDTTNTVQASNDTTYCIGDPAVNLGAQFMINGAPSAAGTGLLCYDQTITYTNPALLNGTNNYTFWGVPIGMATSGTLTVTAYGDLDGAAEFWTIQDENANTIGTAGGSLTQCGTTHVVVIPLSAAQVAAWTANGSIDFAGVDVGGQVNATLCAVGADLLGLRLQLECPAPGSGYSWTPTTGLSDPNSQNPTVTPTTDITYVVKAIGATCDSYDTVNVVMCSVLPVEMLSFDAVCKEERVLLNWATATEINNSHFTIERSDDADNFEAIGTVNGRGNYSTTTNYSFTDNNPLKEKGYYRLKQTDFDGAFEYHGIKSVKCGKETKISIYPNPFESSFTIELSENTTYPLTMEVYDYLGRTIYNKTIENNLTVIALDELSKGTYFVKVFNETTQVVERITKMK
ncbi:MAG: T9SS type A sorting domain-containing protein, partial [Vicingaceae bacterium]|nr:T9SS type A sorting domain-containing protein [Vicingaceae bacterium]